jgi:uncharacterized protein
MSHATLKGYERRPCGDKGDGVFAIRRFSTGELIIRGVIVARPAHNDSHAVEVNAGEFVHEGGLSPIVNHSCDPNCGVRRNGHGALDLIARRPIVRDDEITIDYAMHSYVIEYFPERCLCGTKLCRGRVTGWPDLPEARRAAYTGHVVPSLLERDEASRILRAA